MRLRRIASNTRERGQVVVLFALLLPLILGIGSIVVTIGNWYVHKKHLQTLVDAGVFAGGTAFTGAEHGVWWLVLGLGVGILALGVLSTGRWAAGTAARAAALFARVEA